MNKMGGKIEKEKVAANIGAVTRFNNDRTIVLHTGPSLQSKISEKVCKSVDSSKSQLRRTAASYHNE